MFKFGENKELNHIVWEAYLLVFQYRHHKFDVRKEFFESFKNATSAIIQYYGSIGQGMGLLNHLGPK